jgi:hypothetical protein
MQQLLSVERAEIGPIMNLPGRMETKDGREALERYIRDMTTTHLAIVGRVIPKGDNALLAEILEDIANRYLDLAELVGLELKWNEPVRR